MLITMGRYSMGQGIGTGFGTFPEVRMSQWGIRTEELVEDQETEI